MTWWMYVLAYFTLPIYHARIEGRHAYNKAEKKAEKWDADENEFYLPYHGKRPKPMAEAFGMFTLTMFLWPVAVFLLAFSAVCDGVSAVARKNSVREGFKRVIVANDPKHVREEKSKAELQARIDELEEGLGLKDAV